MPNLDDDDALSERFDGVRVYERRLYSGWVVLFAGRGEVPAVPFFFFSFDWSALVRDIQHDRVKYGLSLDERICCTFFTQLL